MDRQANARQNGQTDRKMQLTDSKPRASTKAISSAVHFTEAYLVRTLGVSRTQLRAWVRAGWITAAPAGVPTEEAGASASSRRGPHTAPTLYAHADLLALKTLLRLRKGGVPAKKLRLIHESLKKRFDAVGIERPFSELHLTGQNKRALLTFQGARMEPLTGQFLLEYSAADIRPLRMPERSPSGRRASRAGRGDAAHQAWRRAERLFSAGLRLEQTPGGVNKAIRAYRAALELNPRAIGALLNLGTLFYNQRNMEEAERYYQAALEVNPGSALAHFNMGNLADEMGQAARAIEHYERAITLDSGYPDPRYNLALVYEKLGRHGQAWKNWRAYLKLDPVSKWADLARGKLAQQQWVVVRPPLNEQEPGQSG